MRVLRRARQEIALLVALADLGGVFDVIAATRRCRAPPIFSCVGAALSVA